VDLNFGLWVAVASVIPKMWLFIEGPCVWTAQDMQKMFSGDQRLKFNSFSV
jgi:hypothetical protein